jgi:energy-coupling factor transporter ATP-binding protein EcfA2
MSEAGRLDENSEIFLRRTLEAGTAVLFTGAGFSSAAYNISGTTLPAGRELRERLWAVAFPGEPFDDSSTLGDIYDVGIRSARDATGKLLRRLYTVDPAKLPEMYRHYLSVPWYRIYTLNIDDLIDAVQRRFTIPHDISSISAVAGELPPPDKLTTIHLNGRLDDLPNVTFSPLQYGRRTASTDVIYPNLVRELATHCTVFIGTQLDEPTMWHHIALRGDKPQGRELRLKSFLVTPRISPARAAMLSQFNVHHVAMSAEEFCDQYVAPVAAKALPRPEVSSPLGMPFDNVALVRAQSVESPADFLLGREPSWGDVVDGFAVARTFESRALEDIDAREPSAVLVTGTAGSGKSTTLRRFALARQAEGDKVLWLRPEASQTIGSLKSAAVAATADVVAIDQAERFGRRGIDLVKSLLESDMRVLAAYAGSAFDDLGVETALLTYTPMVVDTPLLGDEDIDALLDALTAANRLGRLSGMPREQQFREFQQHAGRQLLVAMLEATSGQRFEDKITQECESLSADLSGAYAVTALATSHRYSLSTEDLLAAMSDVTEEGLSIIDRLVRQHLLLKSRQGHLVLRHPVIARQVVTHYRASGQLAEAIESLAFVMASKFYADMPRTPERRLLTNLISHEYLGQIVNGVNSVREVYQGLEPLLRQDADYWLQRGSYELERGDIFVAENFLAQAKGLSEDSPLVRTEWAYLMLKRARSAPSDSRSTDWAAEGVDLLLDVIEHTGRTSPHTYVVLARESLEWCKTGVPSRDSCKTLLALVRATLREGSQYHGGNRHFKQAERELEHAYLSLAV